MNTLKEKIKARLEFILKNLDKVPEDKFKHLNDWLLWVIEGIKK